MSKTKNYLGGLGASILTGGITIIIGLLLCFTVIGSIIGLPLIVIGLAQVVLSPFTGAFFMFKRCPYCQASLLVTRQQKGSMKCQRCKNRLIMKNQKLEVVNVGGFDPLKISDISGADELKKLAELKKQGILTQKEFDKKKTKILES